MVALCDTSRSACRSGVPIDLTTSDLAVLWLSLREFATALGDDESLSRELSSVTSKLARATRSGGTGTEGGLDRDGKLTPTWQPVGSQRVTRVILSCRQVWLARVALAEISSEPGRVDRREAVEHALRSLPVVIGPCAFSWWYSADAGVICDGACLSIQR